MKSKSYLRKVFALSALFFSLANSSHGAVDSTSFNCTFPITDGEQSLRQFTLTADVFNCMEFNNYGDLTIVNGDGKIVPFNISTTQATTQRTHYEKKLSVYNEPALTSYKTGDQIRRIAKLTGVSAGHESQMEWEEKNKFYSSMIVEQTSDDENLDNIVLNISPSNIAISAMVVVEASDDLQQWVTLLSPYHLLILPGDAKTLSNNELPLNVYRNFKYLRIAALSNLENFTQQISGIFGSYQKTQEHQLPLQWLEVSIATPAAKENEWLLEVPELIPVSQIRLSAVNNMVVHQGSLFVSMHKNPISTTNDEETRFQGKEKVKALLKRTIKGRPNETNDSAFQWQFLTWFVDYRLQTDNGVIINAPFKINTTQSHLWKIIFDHPEVSSSEQLPKIELGWRPPQIVFVAQGNGPFQLLAGNNKRAESVRIPSALNGLHNSAEIVGLLDAAEISPHTDENDPSSTSTAQNNYAIWFWLILLAGLLIMIFMAYQLSKSLNKAADTKTPETK